MARLRVVGQVRKEVVCRQTVTQDPGPGLETRFGPWVSDDPSVRGWTGGVSGTRRRDVGPFGSRSVDLRWEGPRRRTRRTRAEDGSTNLHPSSPSLMGSTSLTPGSTRTVERFQSTGTMRGSLDLPRFLPDANPYFR